MTTTTVYYPQIMKADNKWYYVRNAPFYLDQSFATTHARVFARNNPDIVKDFRAISKEVVLDEFNAIVS